MEYKDLIWIKEQLTLSLGEDFIRAIDSYSIDGVKRSELRKREKRAHPLCDLWKSLSGSIRFFNDEGIVRDNHNVKILYHLAVVLKKCESLVNLDRILFTLKNNQQFETSFHELRVAFYYLNLGYSVEAVPEVNARTPDFKVVTNESEVLYVEAKQLEDKYNKEDSYWDIIVQKIIAVLRKYKKCWQVQVIALDRYEKINTEEIINCVEDYCKGSEINEVCLNFDKFNIELRCVGEWGRVYEGEAIIPLLGNINIKDFKSQSTKSDYYKDANYVHITKFLKVDMKDAIRRNIKKASKQYVADYPLIVHVGLPPQNHRIIFDITDGVQYEMLSDMERNFNKINAIIVSSNLTSVSNGVRHKSLTETIIPNFSPSVELPHSFHFDTDSMLTGDVEKSGVIEYGYDSKSVMKAIEHGLYGNIISKISRDAKSQVRLLLTSLNMLRLQLVSPSLKFKNFDLPIDERNLSDGKNVKVVWNEEESQVFINGKLIDNDAQHTDRV
ncbi:hypothetical protein [Salinimonas lutimaris]|uniref:hypothetical protein n=1 Tax=Salinimonas lutimaris TaxID=914153 RepID=UPI0010C00FF3|nr:hypothetical protein [Salinimonas lutimaris]